MDLQLAMRRQPGGVMVIFSQLFEDQILLSPGHCRHVEKSAATVNATVEVIILSSSYLFLCFLFLRQSFTLVAQAGVPRLECKGAISVHRNLRLPGSSLPGITGMLHHAPLILYF